MQKALHVEGFRLLSYHLSDRVIVGIGYVEGALRIDTDAPGVAEPGDGAGAVGVSGGGGACDRSHYAGLGDLSDLIVLGIGDVDGSVRGHTKRGGGEELGGAAGSVFRALAYGV